MLSEEEILKTLHFFINSEETKRYNSLEISREISNTILRIITKLQKENEELKSKNKYLKLENNAYGNEIVRQNLEIVEKDRYIKNSEEITTEMNNDIKKLLLENKQKDKQIELIAEWIFDKDYGKNSLLIHRDDYYSNCIKQVRQYFETKAKEGEEYDND